MHPTKKPYKPGQAIVIGVLLGGFLGLLLTKLALGMIFGFLVGAMVDGHRRKSTAPNASNQQPSDK